MEGIESGRLMLLDISEENARGVEDDMRGSYCNLSPFFCQPSPPFHKILRSKILGGSGYALPLFPLQFFPPPQSLQLQLSPPIFAGFRWVVREELLKCLYAVWKVIGFCCVC